MSFLDNFSEWTNKTLTVFVYGRTYNATTGVYGDPTWAAAVPAVTVKGSIWNKAMAEQYISEQFREEVTDIFCTNVTSAIPADCRLTDGTDTWSVLTREDIAYQGDVYLVGMKRL